MPRGGGRVGAAGRQRREESHPEVGLDGNTADFLLQYGSCLLRQPLGTLPYGNWSAILGSSEGNGHFQRVPISRKNN